MNKTFKRIAAATLAAATLATTMISAGAYDAGDAYRTTLKTSVSTSNGTLVKTAAQRAMYPTYSQADILEGSRFAELRDSGYDYFETAYANKLGTVAAVFEMDEGSGSWPYSQADYLYGKNISKTAIFEGYHWTQGMIFQNIGKGNYAVLQRPIITDGNAYSSPLVARVMNITPEVVDMDFYSDGGAGGTLKIEMNAAYMGTDMLVQINGKAYWAYCTTTTYADESKGTTGKAVYEVKVNNGNMLNVQAITLTNNDQTTYKNPKVTLDGKNDYNIYKTTSYWGKKGFVAGK